MLLELLGFLELLFELGELGVAAVVAGVFDQLLGGFVMREGLGGGFALGEEEAGLFEMVVGEMKPHAAAGGEEAYFVEVVLGFFPFVGVAEVGSSGEEAARVTMVEVSGPTEAANGLFQVFRRLRRSRADGRGQGRDGRGRW